MKIIFFVFIITFDPPKWKDAVLELATPQKTLQITIWYF